MYPSDRRYSKDHEWIAVNDDLATVGITHFAQEELGDIVFVELPQAGKTVRAGEVLGTIESVKAVSEIYAPVSGSVVEANSLLDGTPEAVNRDPHGSGWYCRIRMTDPAELATLVDAEAYSAIVGNAPPGPA